MSYTNLDVALIGRLAKGANECPSRIRFPVGTKTSDTGKVSVAYASFTLPIALSADKVVDYLENMDVTLPIRVSVPRSGGAGAVKIDVQVKPIYNGPDLAIFLVKEKFAPASTKPPKASKTPASTPTNGASTPASLPTP